MPQLPPPNLPPVGGPVDDYLYFLSVGEIKSIRLHKFPITLDESNYLQPLNEGDSLILFQGVDEN